MHRFDYSKKIPTFFSSKKKLKIPKKIFSQFSMKNRLSTEGISFCWNVTFHWISGKYFFSRNFEIIFFRWKKSWDFFRVAKSMQNFTLFRLVTFLELFEHSFVNFWQCSFFFPLMKQDLRYRSSPTDILWHVRPAPRNPHPHNGPAQDAQTKYWWLLVRKFSDNEVWFNLVRLVRLRILEIYRYRYVRNLTLTWWDFEP